MGAGKRLAAALVVLATTIGIAGVAQADEPRPYWAYQRQRGGATSLSPSGAGGCQGEALAWKGPGNDQTIYFAVSTIAPGQNNLPDWARTDVSPEIACAKIHYPGFRPSGYEITLAWKSAIDNNLYVTRTWCPEGHDWWCSRPVNTPGTHATWSDPERVAGPAGSKPSLHWDLAGTSCRETPCTTPSSATLEVVWRGYGDDAQIYYGSRTYDFSRRDGKPNEQGWTAPVIIGSGASTNDAPSYTKVHGTVNWFVGPMYRVVWRGRWDDRMYFSDLGGWRYAASHKWEWSAPEELPAGGATSTAPVASGQYVVWRGLRDDSRVWYTRYTPAGDPYRPGPGTWLPQNIVCGVGGTDSAPDLDGGTLVWKGANGDTRMFQSVITYPGGSRPSCQS